MIAANLSSSCASERRRHSEMALKRDDRHQPSRDLGSSFEFPRVSPSLKEYRIDEFLRHRLIARKARDEAADAIGFRKQIEQLERALVFVGYQLDQRLVRKLGGSCRAELGRCVELRVPDPHIRLPAWRR